MEPTIKGKFPTVIDSTIRAEFVSCQTKGYWAFFRNLGSLGPSIDLVAGGAFAQGLEVTRKAFYGPSKMPIAQALEKGMLAAIEKYGDIEVPEHKEKKGLDRVVSALAAYFTQYPPDKDPIQPMFNADGDPMVEFRFAVPLPIDHPDTGEPILYGGRFDLVGIYNGQIFGVDEKTTSQLGSSWSNKWNMRGQFTGYVWGLRQYDIPVAGMIARGVSFLKNSHGFAESIQIRSPWQVDQWYNQLLHDIERMKQAYLTGWYDQDFNETCAAYSGCPFQRLCQTPDPERWIAGYYGERHWNPLEKVPDVPLQPQQPVEVIDDPMLAALLRK